MKRITVDKTALLGIAKCAEHPDGDGPFEAACEYGFPGMKGGLDHTEVTRNGWGYAIHDRGLSSGSRYHDGSTEFYVQVRDRDSRAGPLLA